MVATYQEAAYADSMRIVSCTRAEAQRQIREMLAGWAHYGDDELALKAADALVEVNLGAVTATVGHTEFRIQEAEAS